MRVAVADRVDGGIDERGCGHAADGCDDRHDRRRGAAQLAVHLRVRQVFDALRAQGGAGFEAFDTLSLGMTADLEAAVAAGSTMVRVGSGIFGARHYPSSPTA